MTSKFWMVILVTMGLQACTPCQDETCEWGYGIGGSDSYLKLPFTSGEYWILTQTYKQGSHVNYGFDYGDDSYAIDFTQNGCDAYGKPVTPVADGVVLETATEGHGDHGYGNTVMVDHGDGYVSRYGHLSEIWVSVGDSLDDSDAIGAVGNTGYSVGTACGDYPGTHLHVALYKDGEAIKPEPLSGNSPLQEYCWYNREGDVNCDGDPGSYTPVEESDGYSSQAGEGEETVDIDGEGQVGISFLGLSPDHGTADETEFVWAAIVVSPDSKPDATLFITNPNDGATYEFEMTTESNASPYVFTYQKSLRDPDTEYEYWVKTSNGDGNDTSSVHTIEVDESEGDVPDLGYNSSGPSNGTAGETEFWWGTYVDSDDEPTVMMNIVSAADATLYTFEVDTDDAGSDRWYAEFEKTLRDPAVYTLWFTAENRSTTNSGMILSVEVE